MSQLLETFQAHNISLSEDEVGREVQRAVDLCGGLPRFVQAFPGTEKSSIAALSAATPVGARFVDIVETALSVAEEAGLKSGPGQQLMPEQVNLFRSGFGPSPIDPRAKAVLELAAMQATALTVEQAATLFDASVEEVREWVEEGGLYGVETGGERRLPIFQLDEQGYPIPHIREVLPSLSRNIHPVGVLHWFTEPNPDLASEETHYASLSPRMWLMRELPTEPVRELAKHVG